MTKVKVTETIKFILTVMAAAGPIMTWYLTSHFASLDALTKLSERNEAQHTVLTEKIETMDKHLVLIGERTDGLTKRFDHHEQQTSKN